MKAILVREPGSADMLFYGDAPDPHPPSGDLLVRVHATALNRADLLQRMGRYDPPPGASPILGLEVAGEVIQAAGDWKIGDRVMAVVTGGAYAELVTVPASVAMRIPRNFSYEQAAAIPEAFLTAYLNLFRLGKLQRHETVLIHAGASGVGTAAIQLAHVTGSRVITTAGSEEKLQRCRELGASLAINRHTEKFVERVNDYTQDNGVNLIVDYVGAPYWNDNLACLAEFGRLMVVGFMGGAKGSMDISPILNKNLTISGTRLRAMSLKEKSSLVLAFTMVAEPLFERNELKPVIDSVFPLEQAAEAHRRMEAHLNIGKIVLKVR